MRRRYPTERETDELLVRKLQRRGGRAVRARLAGRAGGRAAGDCSPRRIDGDFEVSNARWFTGGASKIQMGFDLHLAGPAPTA